MSKNGKTKFNAKVKKAKTQSAKRAMQEQADYEAAKRIVVDDTEALYAGSVKPTEDSVIFKGMNIDIAEALILRADSMIEFPLRDLYLEVPTKNGKKLKIHWKPLNNDMRRKAIKTYLTHENHNLFVRVINFSLDCIVAEVYYEYDNIYGISFAIINPKEKTFNPPYEKVFGIKGYGPKKLTPGCDLIGIVSQSAADIGCKNRARYEEFKDVAENVGIICKATQYLVSRFIAGEEIPKLPGLGLEKSASAHRNPTDSKPVKSKPKEPEKHVAYIYYDVEAGDIVISNSSRHYTAKWWIVRGHQRHLSSGDVVQVTPYIKGDREDPDAQKALQEILSGIERIKYYQLIARRVLE
ncbi:MAG: hypothetical protein Q4A96_03730 [Candidatus Saccharibacteria bacterium]|nr:hypothetical protein [Candidatus Saccharibacteria bacterium]